MRRRLLNLGVGASLALCVAIVALWVWSGRRDDAAGWVHNGNRYTLVSSQGRLHLFAPPPSDPDPAVRREAEALVAKLHNDQVYWRGWYNDRDDDFRSDPKLGRIDQVEPPEPIYGSAAYEAKERFSLTALARPLLAALEDRDRAVAAYALLVGGKQATVTVEPLGGQSLGDCPYDERQAKGGPVRCEHRGASWVRVECDGLSMTLSRWKQLPPGIEAGFGTTSLGEWVYGLSGDAESEQIERVREHWHRKLDVRLASIAYWHAAAAGAVIPLFALGRGICRMHITRVRKRRGLCTACGYDLRARSDRCPECGRPSGAAAVGCDVN